MPAFSWLAFCSRPVPQGGCWGRSSLLCGSLRLEHLSQVFSGVLHSNLAHGTFVRDIVHGSRAHAIEPALVVDGILKHLGVIDHGPCHASVDARRERVRLAIDDPGDVLVSEPIVFQRVRRMTPESGAKLSPTPTGRRRPK